MCSAPTNFRVAVENENENHDAARMNGSERYKYKTQPSENSLSQNHQPVESTSVVEKIQVLSSSDLRSVQEIEMNRDVHTQWPIESESELPGQGLARLKNGRFNKVSKKLLNPVDLFFAVR